MIVTVTANPALDVTYRLPAFRLGESHRVEHHTARAGGKGINVASVLHGLGYDVVPTGLLGGPTGALLRADLRARGLPADGFVAIEGDTRRTVNVLAGGTSTMLNEAGPPVTEADWARLVDRVADLLRDGSPLLVVSGSLPQGILAGAYARLLAACPRGTRVVLDAAGPALLAACKHQPTMVKPNRSELQATLASPGADGDVVVQARALQRLGARDVLVSDGPRGLTLVGADGSTGRAALTTPLAGNPTGAGDALAAAWAAGLVDGLPMEALLRRAVAWSAAAVLHPVAGEVDPAVAADLATRVALTHGPDAAGPSHDPEPAPGADATTHPHHPPDAQEHA